MPPVDLRSRLDFAVQVSQRCGYEVVHAAGLLDRYGEVLQQAVGSARVVVLTDRRVEALYGARLITSLRAAGFEPATVVVAAGEPSKSWSTAAWVLEQLERHALDRRGVLVAFGGGVISDLGGFVASVYMRGVRYTNLSTSMIGQVDASVGGKVAVNAETAKNLYGAFHHPSHVAADAELLATLGARDLRSGVAEAIKMAILASPALFGALERDVAGLRALHAPSLRAVAFEAARLKMELIAPDPYESDLRRPLNLGHTLGHPIETDFGYQGVRHGEAVGIGIAVASWIAAGRGELTTDDRDRILGLLDRYGLLDSVGPIHPDRVVSHLRTVRLIRGGELHFVLPTGIGSVQIVADLPDEELVLGFEQHARNVAERRLQEGA